MSRDPRRSQAAHARRGAADRCQYRQAAGAVAAISIRATPPASDAGTLPLRLRIPDGEVEDSRASKDPLCGTRGQPVSEVLREKASSQRGQCSKERAATARITTPSLQAMAMGATTGWAIGAPARLNHSMTFLPDKVATSSSQPLAGALHGVTDLGIVSSLSTPSPRYVLVRVPMRRRASPPGYPRIEP